MSSTQAFSSTEFRERLTKLQSSSSFSPRCPSARTVPSSLKEISADTVPRDVRLVTLCLPSVLQEWRDSPDVAYVRLKHRSLTCDLVYIPNSDSVIIRNIGERCVLASSNKEEGQTLWSGRKSVITPGFWRLCAAGRQGQTLQVLAEILLFRRRYTVKIQKQLCSATGSKRRIDQGDEIVGVKQSTGKAGSEQKDYNALLMVSHVDPFTEFKVGTSLEVGDAAGCGTDCARGYTLEHRRQIFLKNSTALYRAKHSVLGDIAVKALRTKDTWGLAKTAENLRREVAVMQKVEHGHIVRFYGLDARLHSIFMQYLPYPDLSAKCNRNQQNHFSGSKSDSTQVLSDIVSALAYLHQRDITHNDIKPGNILYDADHGAVLIDFGLATTATETTAGGTPWYLPPEYLLDPESRGQHSEGDIFALGVTMLYLLGETPLPETGVGWDIFQMDLALNHDRMTAWLEQVQKRRSQLDKGDRMANCVSDMLAINQTDRITAAELLGVLHKLSLT